MANNKMDLNHKHSLYKRLENIRTTSRDLYDGETEVKGKGELYLYKAPSEATDAYDYRLKRAYYDNWNSVIVGTRIALMWRKSPERRGFPSEIELFINDIDGRGTHADTFFKEVSKDAAVDGFYWVLVDKTPLPPMVAIGGDVPKFRVKNPKTGEIMIVGENGLSLAQEMALGLRPFTVAIPAANILDWDRDENQKLLWVVIRQIRSDRVAGPGYPEVLIEQRFIWYRDRWEIWEPENPEKQESEITWVLKNAGVNPLGEIPLVKYYGFRDTKEPFIGYPVTKDINGHSIAIYNKASDRDAAEYLTNNPVPVMKSPENPERVEVGGMNGIFLNTESGKEVGVSYLEPTGNGIAASRESERDIVKRIREIALQQAQKETAQVESADTLRQGAVVYTSSLASTVVDLANSEREIWRLFLRWMDPEKYPIDTKFDAVIEYSRDFDDSTIDAAFIKAMSDAQVARQISLKTLWKILKSAEVLPSDFDEAKERNEIQKDLEESGMPLSSGGETTKEDNTGKSDKQDTTEGEDETEDDSSDE